jgi:hypothetical protein
VLIGPCGATYATGKAITLTDATTYARRNDNTKLNGINVLSAWVYFNGVVPEGNAIVCGKVHSTTAALSEWELRWVGALGSFYFIRTNTLNAQHAAPSAPSFVAAPNTWYHVWAMQVGATLYCSVNNAYLGTGALEGQPATNRSDFRIGATIDGAWGWSGRVAQIVTYAGGISESEGYALRALSYNGGAGIRYGDGSGTLLQQALNWYELWETADALSLCDYKGTDHLTKVGAVGTAASVIA